MKDKETPLKLVRLWPKMMPGCYDSLDNLKGVKTEGRESWPDYCELPINAAFTYLIEAGLQEVEASAGAAELTACYLWRKNKIIYSFDEELAATLADQAKETEETDMLPSELLLHPPYPIIYIKASGLQKQYDGFFYWVDYDVSYKTTELRLQWVTQTFDSSYGLVVHLIPGATVHDCIAGTFQRMKESVQQLSMVEDQAMVMLNKVMTEQVFTALQLVLYLSASNADIREDPPEVFIPDSERGKKTVRIEDKAREIKPYPVGVRIGAALQKAKQSPAVQSADSGPGSAKRPHSRRGHWHHYWTGPRAGDRKLILKWTAPTFIHADDIDDNIITIYPVKE